MKRQKILRSENPAMLFYLIYIKAKFNVIGDYGHKPNRHSGKIEFPPPNEEARLDILKIHSRKMNLTRGINLRKIAELMPGASGAEVKV